MLKISEYTEFYVYLQYSKTSFLHIKQIIVVQLNTLKTFLICLTMYMIGQLKNFKLLLIIQVCLWQTFEVLED